jgi:hypothetical protein
VLIGPTALGRTVYGPLTNLARQRNAEIIAGITPREMRLVERCLATMMSNVLAQLEREQQLQAQSSRTRRSDPGRGRARL